ncbi:hypothetical protein VCHC50A1_0222, partial [Vibrio cholerae HC-50A1]
MGRRSFHSAPLTPSAPTYDLGRHLHRLFC